MARVAVITDSASDLDPAEAAEAGVIVVPLIVTFGPDSYRAGVEMSTEAFWERMTAPDAPFPTTAASSPGDFRDAYEAAFADGAEAIISIHVAGTLSGTIKSAQIAREMLKDREIHLVDSQGASKAQAILARMAVAMAADGTAPAEIAEYLSRRASDLRMYVALETLEYLKRGGRISGARAAIGTLLSVKPIIAVEAGVVDTADRVRTRAKARERLIEMITARPIERLEILHTVTPDVEQFRRRGHRAGHRQPRSGDRHGRPCRRIGRTASRPGLPRRSGPLRGRNLGLSTRGRLQQGCRNVVTR